MNSIMWDKGLVDIYYFLNRVIFNFIQLLLYDRITVVAVHGADKFGRGESSIVAQLPVSIRPSLPRFLNFGDEAQFSCTVQNQTMSHLELHVAV